MQCPYCHTVIGDGSKFCTECGAKLSSTDPKDDRRRDAAKVAANSGLVIGAAARQARMKAPYDQNELISTRSYNAIIVGVLLWGLLINALLCAYAVDFVESIDPIVFLIVYLVCAFAGIRMAGKSRNPLISFIGYNLVVIPFGLTITILVNAYGGISSAIVRDAFVYTILISLGMMSMVMISPDLFSKLGGALLGCLIGLLICEIFLLIFRFNQVVTDWIAAWLFSLYIGYDIYRSQQFPKTVDNAVDSALDIYLDIANLFIRLLSIMGRRRD